MASSRRRGRAGISKVKVVEADGDTIVAVRRTGLTEQQKAELAIADNRTSELSEWDPDRLASAVARFELDPGSLAFDEGEWEELLAAAPTGDGESESGSDAAAEGSAEEESPGDSVITDGSRGQTISKLKFGDYDVPMTDAELAGLEARAKAYLSAEGTTYGFVRSLLGI